MNNGIISKIKTGRILNIIAALKKHYGVKSMVEIPTTDKMDALCSALGLSYHEFDNLIANNSPVLRTVKGHCFEVAFELILAKNKMASLDIGGDNDIDLLVNGHNLQLKTPNVAGSTDFELEYKTHKTHGPKSEVESMGYYHKVDDFAEFFVGLISYIPFRVFIIPKEELPRHHVDSRYIKSPFRLNRVSGFYAKYVNAFHLLGITVTDIDTTFIECGDNELLPQTSNKVGLTTEIILNTILREPNFRIWDMSIRGFAREIAIQRCLKSFGVRFSDTPNKIKISRGEKADLAVFTSSDTVFLQVKGISTNNCSFNGINSIIATETQLTRGRVSDHPTQSRLYLSTDFDYLLLALDPPISYVVYGIPNWKIFLIPSTKLKRHYKYKNRYNPMQKFYAKELLQYDLLQSKSLLL